MIYPLTWLSMERAAVGGQRVSNIKQPRLLNLLEKYG